MGSHQHPRRPRNLAAVFSAASVDLVHLVFDEPASGCVRRVLGSTPEFMATSGRTSGGGGGSVRCGSRLGGPWRAESFAACFLCSQLWLPLAQLKPPGWFHTTFPRVRFHTPVTLGEEKEENKKTAEELRGDWILSDVRVVTLLQSRR